MKFLTVFLFLFSIASHAGDGHHHHHKKKKRHHKAHEHGSGKLSLATSGNELEIEFEIPGHDIVGFEHKASTKEQKSKVASAVQFLKNSAANIELPKSSSCVIDEVEVETEYHGDHSEFHIEYEYDCANISKLSYVKVLSFGQFKGMTKLKARGVTDSGQFSKTITAKSPKFDLVK